MVLHEERLNYINTEHVTCVDIFNIVEELDKDGSKIYRLKFKTSGEDIRKGYMSSSRDTVEWEGDRWIRNNQNSQVVLDMIFERQVLEP